MDILLPKIDRTFKPKSLTKDDLPESEYHSSHAFVSSSGLKEMRKSPQHFLSYLEYQQSGSLREETKAMRLGTLCHLAVLEPQRMKKDLVIQPDFGDMRSKTNREERDNWKLSQPNTAIIVDRDELNAVTRVANSVLLNDKIRSLMEHPDTRVELSVLWAHKTGVLARSRFDIFNPTLGVIADLKTTTDPGQDSFARSIWTYKYHMQAAMYLKAAESIGIKDLKYQFIAVESSRPNTVVMYELDSGSIDYGGAEIESAFNQLARCLETGTWPSLQDYTDGVIGLPSWVFNSGLGGI